MKTILVGIDGSEGSQRALKFAAQLARDAGARLHVIHVLWPVRISKLVEPVLVDQIEKEDRADAQRLLDDSLRAAGATDIASTELLTGGAAEELADAGDEHDAWMMVVGTHGRGAAARVLLGSISDRLVKISKRPVLVVR